VNSVHLVDLGTREMLARNINRHSKLLLSRQVPMRMKTFADVLNEEEQDPTQKDRRLEKYRRIIDEQV
jgi:hypothetical protein